MKNILFFNTIQDKAWRSRALFLMLALVISMGNAWGHDTHYNRANVALAVKNTGSGTVYLIDGGQKKSTSNVWDCGGETSGTHQKKFECHCEGWGDGYYFAGWNTSTTDNSSYKSTDATATLEFGDQASEDANSPKDHYYYAWILSVTPTGASGETSFNVDNISAPYTKTISFMQTGGDATADFKDAKIDLLNGTWVVNSTTYNPTTKNVDVQLTYTSGRDTWANSSGTRIDKATLTLTSQSNEEYSVELSANMPNVSISAGTGSSVTMESTVDTKSGSVTFPVTYVDNMNDLNVPTINKTSGEGTWVITSYTYAANVVTVNYEHRGNGTYGTRASAATIALSAKIGGASQTVNVTADYPVLTITGANDSKAFTPSLLTDGSGAATFDVSHADGLSDFIVPTEITPIDEGGMWTLGDVAYTKSAQDPTKGTVTIRYTYNSGGYVGTRTAEITLTALNGSTQTLTLSGITEQEAVNDARVIAADGTTIIYEGDWATAWTKANTAANAGCTLVLLRNVGGLTAYQEVKNTFTLDLNGKVLSGKRSGTLIYLNTTGKTLTIKDSKTGGMVQHINNEYAGTPYCVNITKGSLVLKSGTLYCENQGASGRKAGGVICKAGTTFTMNGGKIDVWGYNGAHGISQESNKNDNTTFTMNGGEIIALGYSDIYGITAAGKVNINDGTINVTATYSNCRGITLTASANATAANCYYGQLTMTGGTINSTCTANADGARYAYGILLEGSYTASMGTGVATDGSHANKAAATGTIENATINVSTLGRYAYGVLANGSYQSRTNRYDVIQIKNTKIDVTSQYYYTYGVYANCGINGTNGGIYAANIELTNCDVTATTTKNHTAYCLWATTTATTIYKNVQPNYYGEYAGGATITVNSGTYTANTGTTTAYAIGTSARAKTTYGSESNVTAERKLGGNAEGYATLNIHGGKFIANAGTTTARAVSNGGNCTIDGGEFYATSGSTTADGIYTVSGKLKASGVKIEASATGTVYGVRVDAVNVPYKTDAAWTGFNYAGDAELNNLDVTVTARTGATAYGVYLNAVSYQYTQSAFDTYMQGRIDAGKVTQANADIWAAVFPGNSSYAIAGKAVINGGKYTVTAATTTAHGIYSVNRAVSNDKAATAATEMTVKNVKLDVKTNGTTTACGIRTAGPSTIDGADIKVNSQTTTCYGMIISDQEETTVTNTKIDASGTATVYGIYVNASAPSTTNGYDWHGKAILGDGNDVTAAATAGNTSYAIYVHSNKAGTYINAGEVLINDGKYKATASGTTAYAVHSAAKQTQGEKENAPSITINGGKFWAEAPSTYADISSACVPGYCVINGGYYRNPTNIDARLGEYRYKFALKPNMSEYKEGYRWYIKDDVAGEAVWEVYNGDNILQGAFDNLPAALELAKIVSSAKVVPTTNYTLPAGNYTIPSGVTLLIPCDDSYSCPDKPKSLESKPALTMYRKLTLDKDVKILVESGAMLYVAGHQYGTSSGNPGPGCPVGAYGSIDMNKGGEIIVKGTLRAYGFISGKGNLETTGTITVDGGTVYEDFIIADMHGGGGTAACVNGRDTKNDYELFPLNQYFIQNIEPKMTLKNKAEEFAIFNIGGTQQEVELVGSENSFLFQLHTDETPESTWTKWYDYSRDYICYEVYGEASLNSITLEVSVLMIQMTFSSSKFILPITNNMDVTLAENTTMHMPTSIKLLPGAKITVEKGAVVNLQKPLYIYDAEEWDRYAMGFGQAIKDIPGHTVRDVSAKDKFEDASLVVNGTINIVESGALYTTATGGDITSTGGGKIVYNKQPASNPRLYEIYDTYGKNTSGIGLSQTDAYGGTNIAAGQVRVGEFNLYIGDSKYATYGTPITCNPAWLHNGEEWYKDKEGEFKQEHLATAEVSASTTIQYANNHWGWMEIWKDGETILKISNTCTKVNDPTAFDGSLSKEGHTLSWTTTVNNDNQEVIHTATWTPIKYTITWKNGETVLKEEQVEYGTTPTYSGETPTKAADAQYTYTFAGWNLEVVAVTGDATYTATFTQTAQTYTVVFDANGGAGAMESQSFTYGEEAKALTANTFTRTGYTFDEWNTVADGTGTSYENEQSVQNLTENITLYAQWTFAQVGDPLDIVDANNTNDTLTINTNGWASSGWPYTVNGVKYKKGDRKADRTLVIPYSGQPDDDMLIEVKDTVGTVVSYHMYKVPFVYTGGTEDMIDMNYSIVFVKSGTLSIEGTASAKEIYVAPGAALKVKENSILDVKKLVLRTTPFEAAILTNKGTIVGQVYYSRIARDTDFHLFAIPAGSNTAKVVLSDGTSAAVASTVAPYGNAWQLREYNTARRAEKGDDGANWNNIGWDNIGENGDTTYSDAAIKASKGYELRSGSKYYREYLFPVTLPTTATSVQVTDTTSKAGAVAGAAHAGWNILCSPYTDVYIVEYEDNATGIKVSWQYQALDGSYSYIQVQPEQIKPAVPFAYQASANGSLDFSADSLFFKAPRKQSAAEALTETEWIHLDIFDAYGEGDETSLFVHPTRFEQTYKTGIDVAKQSLTAARPIIYSTHAYGDMAFAGVADSLLENGIDIAVYSPAAQQLTFSLRENKFLHRLEYLWLADNETGERTDLLMDDYTCRANAGTIKGRFVLNGRFKAPQISTGIDNTHTDYNIYAIGNNIAISGVEQGTPIYVFDAVGHMIYTTAATSDEVIVPAPCAGVYMLTIGGQTAKLVINQ